MRKATTGDDGIYKLPGCGDPQLKRIVVTAKNRAMDMKDVLVEPEMQPVNFVVRFGGKIRIRVLDEMDNPIPKAQIEFRV